MDRIELEQRTEEGESEPLIIAKSENGFRVYSPLDRRRAYLVSGSPGALACTCPDFETARDPDWRCEHIIAVERNGAPRAIKDEDRTRRTPKVPNETASQMVIKRSVSPDGRIDALSVEFSCPVADRSALEIESRAVTVLRVQDAIARRFLRRNGEEIQAPATTSAPRMETGVPAQMVDIGGMDGKWGRRLFLRFQANGRMLRLFGNRKQLAERIAEAGFRDFAEDIREGARLHLPCRIVTTPSEDGRFLNITEVLPIQGESGA